MFTIIYKILVIVQDRLRAKGKHRVILRRTDMYKRNKSSRTPSRLNGHGNHPCVVLSLGRKTKVKTTRRCVNNTGRVGDIKVD